MADLWTVDPLDCDPRDHEPREEYEPDVDTTRCVVCRDPIDGVDVELPDGSRMHLECEADALITEEMP